VINAIVGLDDTDGVHGGGGGNIRGEPPDDMVGWKMRWVYFDLNDSIVFGVFGRNNKSFKIITLLNKISFELQFYL
jgi:hypothetical protein